MKITYRIEQFVRNVIRDYQSEFLHQPNIGCNDCAEYGSSLQKWVTCLLEKNHTKYVEYAQIMTGIDVHQRGTKALFHYVGFDVIYGELNPEEYWSSHGGLYRTCRSTVIDLATGEVLIKPFDKFFNIGELPETQQEIVEKKVQSANLIEISDKLDGSILCASCNIVRGHRNKETRDITYCTSQSLDPVTSWHLELGLSMVTPQIEQLLNDNPGTTFMFEMINPKDAHVVFYPDSETGLHLIGIRDNLTGKLATYSDVISTAQKYNIQSTRVFNKTLGQVLTELDDKTSDEAEGFVIRVDDAMYKLKYNDYVFMHKTINRLTSASLVIESYRNGTIDDLLSKIPLSYKQQVTEVVQLIDNAKEAVQSAVEKAKMCTCSIPDFVERMKWIQVNVPKVLSGYTFEYVKTGHYEFFKESMHMDLKKFRKIIEDSEKFCSNDSI